MKTTNKHTRRRHTFFGVLRRKRTEHEQVAEKVEESRALHVAETATDISAPSQPVQKRVYFVRHGETGGNKILCHQFPDTPLNAKGRGQAYQAGLALNDSGAETVLASHLTRAQESAAIIADTIGGVAVEVDEELREVRRASHIWGKHHYGLTSLFALAQFFLYGLFGNKRAYDEETLHEFVSRIVRVIEKIEQRPEHTLVVVTHRGVLSELVPLLKHNKLFTGYRNVLAFLGMYAIDNGEYTIADFDGTRWHVRKKNVNEHLR